MPDVIQSHGAGTTAGTGTAAIPETILTLSSYRRNWVTLVNDDPSNEFRAKEASDGAPYKVAVAGGAITLRCGNPNADNLTNIVGFGNVAGAPGTAVAVPIHLAADGY